MNVTDSMVRSLHHQLTLIEELQNQIARGPKQIVAAQQQLESAQQNLVNCKNTIRQRRLDADRKQLQQREREAKLLDLEAKMNSAKGNREYQTLKEQIAADSQANSVLSDEIFETLEEIDRLDASTHDLQSLVKSAEDEKEKVTVNVEKRIAGLKEDLKRIQERLADLESQLPDAFLSEYRRMIGTRGADALSELDTKSCGGCNTNVTPRVLDKLRCGEPALCPSCGRMLYRPED